MQSAVTVSAREVVEKSNQDDFTVVRGGVVSFTRPGYIGLSYRLASQLSLHMPPRCDEQQQQPYDSSRAPANI